MNGPQGPVAEVAETEKDAETGTNYVVPGLERGLRILCAFSEHEPELEAPELARRLGIPRTTVFRLLQTLNSLGYLERCEDARRYRLGASVLRLGFEHLAAQDMTDLGLPLIEALRDETGFTAHILIRDGRDVVFVAKAQSYTQAFGAVKVNVGSRLPAHASTHGHVLMGDLTRAELRALYPEPELQRYTPQTPATVAELYERVRDDAARGYAIGESSFENGISVVSAPVFDSGGCVAAVVSIAVPYARIPEALLEGGLVGHVLNAARELSARLNYRPDGRAAARRRSTSSQKNPRGIHDPD